MSEEEKKAIVELNHFSNITAYWKQEEYTNSEIDNYVKTILNLIEKQQKEIEELKEKNKEHKERITFLENKIHNQKYYLKTGIIEKKLNVDNLCKTFNLISKDKIKAILGIEEDIDNEKLLSLLQTIVDENARLEDIEDRKVQVEYNNVFNKGVKSVEDKIKAKIEPKLKELDKQINEEWKKYGNSKELQDMEDMYNFLQSLLEKE